MLNIAIDGPSGSGKSTVAKLLSEKLNVLYLDTGAMYRACAVKARDEGVDLNSAAMVDALAEKIRVTIAYVGGEQITYLDGKDVSKTIRENEISLLASKISAYRSIREKMVEAQREVARTNDCILDGRDVGTNVLPNAKFKFFVTASIEVRAERRFKELAARGETVDIETLKKEMQQRDYQDAHREISPLKQAKDAVLIDTSNLTVNEVLDKILSIISDKAKVNAKR